MLSSEYTYCLLMHNYISIIFLKPSTYVEKIFFTMNNIDFISRSAKPELYEQGTAFMWTDKHISKQLLAVHLNPEIDLASRKMTSIKKTAKWILNMQKQNAKLNILDLGCGPGLYSEIFAQQGHSVTGVDISEESIKYAEKSAKDKKLDITYINANYLELELEEGSFDLAVLVYTDFGVLLPEQREKLLRFIYKVLKKGGMFIFDVLKDKNLEEKMTPRSWEAADNGFWKDEPYLALSESFLYPKEKTILYQHILLDSKDNMDIYRFWTHFFSETDLQEILQKNAFTQIGFRDDILPQGNLWNGDNVMFTTAIK